MKIRQFGLIGRYLEHSFSPIYFNNKFAEMGLKDHRYNLYPINHISAFNDLLYANDFKGLNVTIPYKEEIIPYLDSLSIEAQKIGSVNTIAFSGDKLIGFNTDYIGFIKSIKPFLKKYHFESNALILGSGGSAKAIKYALMQLNIKYHVVSRTKDHDYTYDELNEDIIKASKLIINTTPLGMYPNVELFPLLPYKYITNKHLVFDLVYNPSKTQFLEKAGDAVKLNGNRMLEIQAEEAWKIWNSNI